MANFNTRPAIDRFMEKVVMVPEAGCWLWVGACKPTGYGNFYFEGKHVNAHKASYTMHAGPVPDGMCVCHRCDTPACVNPGHLFLGTHSDNTRDMRRKGRAIDNQPSGESNGNAKLTLAEVASIRVSEKPTQQLADALGVTYQAVWQIRNGRSWKDAA